MTSFEWTYLLLEPVYLPLHHLIHKRLRSLVANLPPNPKILDVGGRKSHYTTGLAAEITILDLPRESDVQRQLNLGLLPTHLERMQARRSNIKQVVLEDMTRSTLPEASFDLVVSVEVLEHVEEDALFIQQVARVLKPGGFFLMTTPNGDFLTVPNRDHKRHYKREQLRTLLSSEFNEPQIEYAICGGRYHSYGLKSWSPGHPVQTALSMFGNLVNFIESSRNTVSEQAEGTHHLIALSRK